MVPVIVDLARSVRARSALDMFSGSGRVSVAMKEAGMTVTSVDSALYAWALAQTWVGVDGTSSRQAELDLAVAELNKVNTFTSGWFTRTYCEEARYIHPSNGPKIETIRDLIDERHAGSWMHPCLVAAVLLSADRVDSTVGTQTAYLKTWAPRALNPFHLQAPTLIPGQGTALCVDATIAKAGYHDFAYMDPPYNQHNYERHYHLHEQIARWGKPAVSGVARKPDGGPSAESGRFTRKTSHQASLEAALSNTDAGLVVLSYSDEAFLPLDTIVGLCEQRGTARVLQFTAGRYIGSELGGHGPDGERVSDPGHNQNVEYMIVAGDPDKVDRVCSPYSGSAPNRLDAPGQFNLF